MCEDVQRHETLRCIVFDKDTSASLRVCGAFSWDEGSISYHNVVNPESLFYPGQCIRVGWRDHTLTRVDLKTSVLYVHPQVRYFEPVDHVFVDPPVRMRLVNGAGVSVLTVLRDGELRSPWMDRLVQRLSVPVDGSSGPLAAAVFINGWRVIAEGTSLVFENGQGEQCMMLDEDGTLSVGRGR